MLQRAVWCLSKPVVMYEQRKTNPELIKSVGVLEQYPDYEDWDENDEF